MKKLLSVLLLTLVLAFGGLVACGEKLAEETKDDPVVPTTYTVAFEVDGARYDTKKVKEGETISGTVADPTKSGFDFDGWMLNGEKVDIYTYKVNSNVTFVAAFTEIVVDESLNVNDVKDAEKTYYLVIGWWECTDVKEDGSPKLTSYLTDSDMQMIFANLNLYLKAKGATDAEIASVSVRNYSTNTVSAMGEKVLADGDVDIMIGVGNNVNSTAGLALYESSNDNKFSTAMGSSGTSRYVALLSSTRELGVNVFDWFKTEVGKKALTQSIDASEITVVPERSNEINLTVIIHGDTDATTVLTDDLTVITMPTITVADDKEFKGFALTSDGEVALNVAINSELTYDNVKSLVNVGDDSLELYPVFDDKIEQSERVHYVKIAWYDNSASGLTSDIIKEIKTALETYLTAEGVSATDIATIEFKAYSGKVGPSTEDINKDGDVDIMLGWGSDENITTTGKINASSLKESIKDFTIGEKTRWVHVLSSDESVVKTMEFIRTADLEHFKAPSVSK